MLNPARSTMRGTIPIAHADHDTHKTHTHCVLLLYALTTCGYAESRAKRRVRPFGAPPCTSCQCNIAGPMFCDCAHPVPCSADLRSPLHMTSNYNSVSIACQTQTRDGRGHHQPATKSKMGVQKSIVYSPPAGEKNCLSRAGLCVTGLCVTGAPGSENGICRRPLNQNWVCKNRSSTDRPPARRTVSHGRRASASRASASRASASRVSASRTSASRGLLGPKMALPAGH